jgi:hypothetical protein
VTLRLNDTVAAAASDAAVQLTVPFPPTGGVVQLQPAGALADTKPTVDGTGIDSEGLDAALGPLFVSPTV